MVYPFSPSDKTPSLSQTATGAASCPRLDTDESGLLWRMPRVFTGYRLVVRFPFPGLLVGWAKGLGGGVPSSFMCGHASLGCTFLATHSIGKMYCSPLWHGIRQELVISSHVVEGLVSSVSSAAMPEMRVLAASLLISHDDHLPERVLGL